MSFDRRFRSKTFISGCDSSIRQQAEGEVPVNERASIQ